MTPSESNMGVRIPKSIDEINLSSLPEGHSIKIFPKALYKGELVNNKRHGKGLMSYESGRFYDGDWLNDLRDGNGYEKYSNGNTYEGAFKQGRAHGKGTYTWISGDSYNGQWEMGMKQGQGVWKTLDGESYIGEWDQSKPHGYGIHIWKQGDRYEGQWQHGLKHGKGTDVFASGDMYIGQYSLGKPTGEGTYLWTSGSLYKGSFFNGIKHGKGKWIKNKFDPNSNNYEGEYFNDKKNGYGVFKWKSGNIYKGNYKEDLRDGYGEMHWTDGSIYKGEWVKGIQHGYGEMIFPDGKRKSGIFENNTFVGRAESNQRSRLNISRSRSKGKLSHEKYKERSFDSRKSINKSPQITYKNNSLEVDRTIRYSSVKRKDKRKQKNNSTLKHRYDHLPYIDRMPRTNHGSREPMRFNKLNQTRSNFSKIIYENLRYPSQKRGGKKRKQEGKPIWRPVGNIPARDGYSVIRKMYY
ncbi:unnamed protein product [Moneuplotes crassus]|uniref:Phosphatidylinositol-4-phosphate 5-kinase n=1 Tax=Euplotes crassus TaxID=5936 RepID=A0AAD1UDM5_EUPCR|nr:unnamed protein product [Moneuplotes crassus]